MNVDRGSIRILTGNSEKVEVKVVRELRHASDAKAKEIYAMHRIDMSQSGDTVKIEAQNPRKSGTWGKNPFNNLQVEYTVFVPSKYNLDLHTAGGSIEISDLEGEVNARTSGGNLRLAAITGAVKVHTSGGSIILSSGKGPADLHTSGGNLKIGQIEGDLVARTSGGTITVDNVRGSVDAETSGGNIYVNEAFGPVMARTSGGSVSAKLNEQPKSKSVLRTSGGNVAVTLADNLALDVNAHTSGGSVRSDFPGDFNKQRTKLVAQLNGGGPDLLLETSGGTVDIRRK